MQDADGGRVGLVGGEGGGGGVQLGDVADEAGELGAVGGEALDDAAGVADDLRGVGEQAGVAGLGDGLGVERPPGDEGEGDEARGRGAQPEQCAPPGAEQDEGREEARGEADEDGAQEELGEAVPELAADLVGEPVEFGLVLDQLLGLVGAQVGEARLQGDGPPVGVEPEGAERGQLQDRPAVQGRVQGELDVRGADGAATSLTVSSSPTTSPSTSPT
ncbi:hypothetical protein GCM10023178_53520 [Actinomadura luteofluorescens]